MSPLDDASQPPVIDLSLFEAGDPWRDHLAAQIDWTAAEFGAFGMVGHGVDLDLIERVRVLGRSAVSRSEAGVEFNNLYDTREFGSVPGFREAAAEYLQSLSGLSHRLLTSIGRALRRDDNFFVDHHTGNPEIQWRLSRDGIGVRPPPKGLLQIDPSHEPGVLVCRVGEVLERLSGGRYRAVAIQTVAGGDRPSAVAMPFSFDSATASTQRVGNGRRSRAAGEREVVAPVIAGWPANAPWAVG